EEKADEHVVLLDGAHVAVTFGNVASRPRASLNRGFSAPIRLIDDLGEADRAALAGVDDDPFAQWDGLQSISRAVILDAARAGKTEPDAARLEALVAALEHSLDQAASDNAYAALLLYVPTVGELIHDLRDADPSAIHAIRLQVRRAMARRLEKK